jgi:hypothetical protein
MANGKTTDMLLEVAAAASIDSHHGYKLCGT